MITEQLQSYTIVTDPANCFDHWAVYEHHMVLEAGAPPTLIYIGTCRFGDVLLMPDAKLNTEWRRMTETGASVMVRIVMTTDDQTEAQREFIVRLNACEPKPRCNIFGYSIMSTTREIICSNGKTYRTQTEAARDLACSQSQISNVLRKTGRTVRGHTLAWKE